MRTLKFEMFLISTIYTNSYQFERLKPRKGICFEYILDAFMKCLSLQIVMLPIDVELKDTISKDKNRLQNADISYDILNYEDYSHPLMRVTLAQDRLKDYMKFNNSEESFIVLFKCNLHWRVYISNLCKF